MTQTNASQNPLLVESTLKNRAIPYPDIQPEHFLPALQAGIEKARKLIEDIKANPEEPNFQNTIDALEHTTEDMGIAASVFYNMMSAHTNEKLQKLAQEIGPMMSAFSSELSHDEHLYARVQRVWDNRDHEGLNPEQMQLLENTYMSFVRNGASLTEEKRNRVKEIDERKSQLSPKFSENVLKVTNAFEMYIDNESDLEGLPESAVDAAAHAAEEKGKKGQWLFTLHAPSLMPFLQYSAKRELREKLWTAFNSRCCDGENSNADIILELVKLRHERAQLLGFQNHAEYTLDRRMAESPEKVNAFLDRLLQASKTAALKDLTEVRNFASETDGLDHIEPWDVAYYSQKLKQKKFEFSDEDLRPYFQLEKVIDGAFLHASKLYGLEFRPTQEYPLYHEDVKVFEVYAKDSGKFIGLLYTDFFPRESKRGGAWMTHTYEQGMFKGEEMRPHVSIVCNFTKPTKDKPSLLTFMEVRTLFHEFGHSLHCLMSQVHYRSLAGTHVFWDFVELPSQVMENWIYEKEGLDLFAEHYETGEKIPEELTRKIKDSAHFQAGMMSLRQLNFATLDMQWHTTDPTGISSVDEFEKQATKETSLFPKRDGMNSSSAFSHIFAGGYSAGYYSYKWAEVLDADAFEYFKEKGLFNEDVAKAFKTNVLEKGGSEHPMKLYKQFRGREPDPDALLRRDGLI